MPSVDTPLRGDLDLVHNVVRSIGGVRVLLANGASGPPTTGNHQAGEVHTDKGGGMHVCTVTGSPGTWVTMAASGAADAGTLTGTTLAANVVSSSLTSVGTLTGLTMGGTLTIGAHTLALAGATVTGQPTWSSNQNIALATAAQPNVTSLGTLTGLTVSAASALARVITPDNSTAPIFRTGQSGAVFWDQTITTTAGDWQLVINGGGTAIQIVRSGTAVANLQLGGKLYPCTDAAAQQTAAAVYAGTGAPSNANGANGDYYLRSDGSSATTHIYFKTGSAWTGIA